MASISQISTSLQITGRKENVEEAQKRILAQVERLVRRVKLLLLHELTVTF